MLEPRGQREVSNVHRRVRERLFFRALATPLLIGLLPPKYKPHGAAVVAHLRKGKRRLSHRLTKTRQRIATWFAPPPAVAVIPVEEFLHDEHIALLELERRQHLLEAIDAEWPRITRGKPYWIHDDSMFRAITDVDAMNVVDLCSWCIGAADADASLLQRAKNHYIADLPPVRRWTLARHESEDSYLTRLTDEGFIAARQRLFPKAQGRTLREADVEELIKSFAKRVLPLKDDRNKNRAHAYEHKTHGTAPMLDLADVKKLYRDARQLLNDLCLVAFGSTWADVDLTSNNVSLSAEDMLDVVFLPNWFRREMAGSGMSREAIYEALHADSGPGNFNDKAKLVALADGAKAARRTKSGVS